MQKPCKRCKFYNTQITGVKAQKMQKSYTKSFTKAQNALQLKQAKASKQAEKQAQTIAQKSKRDGKSKQAKARTSQATRASIYIIC